MDEVSEAREGTAVGKADKSAQTFSKARGGIPTCSLTAGDHMRGCRTRLTAAFGVTQHALAVDSSYRDARQGAVEQREGRREDGEW